MTGLLGGFNRKSYLMLEHQLLISTGELDLELGKGFRILELSHIVHVFSVPLNVSMFFSFFFCKERVIVFDQILKGL